MKVSVVIPARNEARYIEACVRSVVAQGVHEVVVVDDGSIDDTRALAAAAGARVVASVGSGIPAALNTGLAAVEGDVLVRFDAHALMPPGYVAACLRALEEEQGAGNVGGWRRAEGVGPWGRATGAVLASPLGVGNARIWREPPADAPRADVETVPLGCFPVEELRSAGGWREDLLANEDFELNHRLRSLGLRVVFDPAIRSVYRPRESPRALARQYWNYGRWKARMLREAPESLRARQLAPPALVCAAALAALPGRAGRPARGALAAYGALLSLVAARPGFGPRAAAVLATMHLCWGAGLLAGLATGPAGRYPSRAQRFETKR